MAMGGKIKSFVKPIFKPIAKLALSPFNNRRLNKSRNYLKSLKNSHLGERCFIVGNGPSLTTNDLNKLIKEESFGANGIYNIFNSTDWGPKYFCSTDRKVISKTNRQISEKITGIKFIGVFSGHYTPFIKDAYYLNMKYEDFYPNLPKFSDDISKRCIEGNTVTYTAIQLAVYMGFKKIYLIGVDHSYSMSYNPDGTISKNEGVVDYFNNTSVPVVPALYKTTLAYEAAKQYADAHGIKIYNATRGGRLEVFERVDFDTLFN